MAERRFSGFGGGVRRAAGAVALGAVAAGGCAGGGGATDDPPRRAANPPHLAPAPGLINHVVFFELQDPADAEALIEESLKLGTIPGVAACYAGRHIDTGRSTVLTDYDVGFFVAFDSEAAYAAYVSHPDHVALVEKWRPKLRALRVYDILDEREAK